MAQWRTFSKIKQLHKKEPTHIKRRVKERLGFTITEFELKQIADDIKNDRKDVATFIKYGKGNTWKYRVNWHGYDLTVIYDFKAGRIRTLYPVDEVQDAWDLDLKPVKARKHYGMTPKYPKKYK